MRKHLITACCMRLCVAILCALSANFSYGQSKYVAEEIAIRDLVNRFYDGWNAHDVEKMVSIYADSVDHVNAFGEWHTGKQTMREELIKFHAGPGKNSRKTITIEKIKFIKPDVAVALVRQVSTVGNIGTFVFSKASGKWLVESFANVPYDLPQADTKRD